MPWKTDLKLFFGLRNWFLNLRSIVVFGFPFGQSQAAISQLQKILFTFQINNHILFISHPSAGPSAVRRKDSFVNSRIDPHYSSEVLRRKPKTVLTRNEGWGLRGPGSNADLRTTPTLPFPSLPRVFIFSFPSSSSRVWEREVSSLAKVTSLVLSHFLQGLVPSAFLSEFHLHFLHLYRHVPFFPQIHFKFPSYKMSLQPDPCWSLVSPLHSCASGERGQ